MTTGVALDTLRETFMLALEIALPLLLISMIVGVVLAIFSAATSINEQTLTFVPKLLSILIVLALLGSTILVKIQEFFVKILDMIASGG
ncbi:flagellar biosynthetic protein FliQ [Oribacterium sp. KHPX15]|uniref:flagellar biosynthetic protein FliQ n=1 Tax=unclassified Oribacterium TaxID=2629782 RepID=UPI0004E160B1|nr:MULTISPECIES: flagellar biosynthetic protein FliQ [unclassified Oribacterium]SEA42390.1 flagellar biosynthetic protein FliQ [Oribacterium sp. KHPX15]